jgi:4-amino-4-deoxy-L-arabinose transferase-like glycosyltransferase
VHPPLYTLYLAFWSLLGLKSVLAHRLVSCLLGAATVALLGLLGRRLAGEGVGLLAAALGAVYPHLWLNDGQLAAETATAFTVVLLMLAVERFWRTRSWPDAAFVGGATALCALARAELVLLFALIALPVVLIVRGDARERLVRSGACLGAGLVLLGPWVGWNAVRFHHPELVSSGFGTAVNAGTCDVAFAGDLIGYWGGTGCTVPQVQIPPPAAAVAQRWQRDPDGTAAERRAYFRSYLERDVDAQGRLRDESDVDLQSRRAAWDYVRDHAGRAPLVVAARLGRVWNVFKPLQDIRLDASVDGRGTWPARLAFVAYFLYTAAAIAGVVVLRRRGHPIFPYVMLAVEVCIAVAITYGIQRFRIPVDAVAPALAAVALAARWPNLRRAS